MQNYETLSSYSKDELIRLIELYSKNWLAMDGVWFQSIERTRGMDEAMFHDAEAWKRFTVIEARRIKEFLQLPERPGLDGLARALRLRFYANLNEDRIEIEGNTLTYTSINCRVQRARERKGMPFHPCKEVGIIEYRDFCRGLTRACIGCGVADVRGFGAGDAAALICPVQLRATPSFLNGKKDGGEKTARRETLLDYPPRRFCVQNGRLCARQAAAARNGYPQSDIPSDNLGREAVAPDFGVSPRPHVCGASDRSGTPSITAQPVAPFQRYRTVLCGRVDLSGPVTGPRRHCPARSRARVVTAHSTASRPR